MDGVSIGITGSLGVASTSVLALGDVLEEVLLSIVADRDVLLLFPAPIEYSEDHELERNANDAGEHQKGDVDPLHVVFAAFLVVKGHIAKSNVDSDLGLVPVVEVTCREDVLEVDANQDDSCRVCKQTDHEHDTVKDIEALSESHA